jgi:cobalt-zinc-cadmium efflux system membrane fusion protein
MRALAAAAVPLLLLAACQRGAAAGSRPAEDEVWLDQATLDKGTVRLEKVEVRDLPQAVSGAGKIAFHDLHVAHVFSPVTGRITRVLARPGERVQRGAPLLSLLSPDVGSAFADLVKAHADLEQARAELVRQRRLAAVQASTQRDLEAAEDTFRKAQAEHDRTQQRAALLRSGAVGAVSQEYTLLSFIDGEVMARQANPGAEIQGQYSGGSPVELFTIGDIKRVWVTADVADADLPRVAKGAAVSVRVAAYPGRVFSGQVEWISAALDPVTRTAKVRAELVNEDEALKPEMYAQVSVATPPRRVLAIPRRAVTSVGGQAFVSVEAGVRGDGRRVLKRRLVHLVAGEGDQVEVRDGLMAGEVVLVEGALAADPGVAEAELTPGQVAASGIEAAQVLEQDVPDAVALGGRLAFDDLSVTHVFSPVSGRVTRVLAQPGQRVRRGEPLLAIQSPDVGQAVSDVVKAEADLTQAAHERTRQRELFEGHAGARRDLEAAEAAWQKAQAEVDRARQKTQLLRSGMVDQVTQEFLLPSPIDGEVVARSVNPGAEVQGQYSGASAAAELFTIGRVDRLQVLADAYEVDLPRLQEGAAVAIQVAAYPGRTFRGTIEWVADVLDPQLRTARVRCVVENSDHLLRPEMYEAVTIQVPGKRLLAVPRAALLRVGEETIVFVDAGERGGKRIFQRRRVTADEGRSGGLVPVAGAVLPGERVVVKGAVFVLGML